MLIGLWGKYEQQTLKGSPEGKMLLINHALVYIFSGTESASMFFHASRPTFSLSIHLAIAGSRLWWPSHSTSSLQ
jgi:hypothetical protein